MSGVYFLSITVERTFTLLILYLKKSTKMHLTFQTLFFALCEKLSNFSSFFIHLSFSKVLYKSVVLSIIKVPYKSVLLSIATCRHIPLTSSYPKVLYKSVLLSSKNVALHNLTSLIIPKGVF